VEEKSELVDGALLLLVAFLMPRIAMFVLCLLK